MTLWNRLGFLVLALPGKCIWRVRGPAQNLTAESPFAPCQSPFVTALLRYTSFGAKCSCGFQHHRGRQHSQVLRSSVWAMSLVVTSSVSGHSALRGMEPDAQSRGSSSVLNKLPTIRHWVEVLSKIWRLHGYAFTRCSRTSHSCALSASCF